MAKLPVLIDKLAPFDGRPKEALAHMARLVRERGFITTTKRGGGAAEMTARDAANLLIALNGSEMPKEAPEAVAHFRALQQVSSKTNLPPVSILHATSGRTFGEALEKLIEIVPDAIAFLRRRLAEDREDEPTNDEELDRGLLVALRKKTLGLEVRLFENIAKVELYSADEYENRRVHLEALYTGWFAERPSLFKQAWSDRDLSVSFGLPTLMATWFALHPAEQIGNISESSIAWMRNLKLTRSPIVASR